MKRKRKENVKKFDILLKIETEEKTEDSVLIKFLPKFLWALLENGE